MSVAHESHSIVVVSQSLCITSWTTVLVCTFLSRSRATCSVSISNGVLVLVDFEHRLEFNLHDDVHGLSECRGKMNLDGQVAFCIRWQHDPSHASRVRSKPKKVCPSRKRQTVPIVLRHIAVRGEQVDVTPDVPPLREFRLKGFGGHLLTVRVHGIERVVNTAQHYTCRLGA